MKKLLALLIVVLFVSLAIYSVTLVYKKYQIEYEESADIIVYEVDGYETKGLLLTYYEVCTDDECYSANTIIYSDEYGEGIFLKRVKSDKNFLKYFISSAFFVNSIYKNTLVIGLGE